MIADRRSRCSTRPARRRAASATAPGFPIRGCSVPGNRELRLPSPGSRCAAPPIGRREAVRHQPGSPPCSIHKPQETCPALPGSSQNEPRRRTTRLRDTPGPTARRGSWPPAGATTLADAGVWRMRPGERSPPAAWDERWPGSTSRAETAHRASRRQRQSTAAATKGALGPN